MILTSKRTLLVPAALLRIRAIIRQMKADTRTGYLYGSGMARNSAYGCSARTRTRTVARKCVLRIRVGVIVPQ
eukprot:scaffold88498_cov18-Prasinocladus_malaysianus.AAC.1